MNQEDSTRPNEPTYCSRSEAIALAISAMLWSHAVTMAATLGFEVLIFGPAGVVIGLGLVAAMLAILPAVVLPVAFLIGSLAHRLFDQTLIAVPMAIRVLAILFEVNLFGWVVFTSLQLL